MSSLAVVTLNVIPESPAGFSLSAGCSVSATFKYEFLGELSLINHRIYCERRGYGFIAQGQIDRSRPACWAKVPAVLAALDQHEWVLWADSDTLFPDFEVPLEQFCDPAFDLIVQDQKYWWELVGFPDGDERFPLNSGVFLIRSTPWSRRFLEDSYNQVQYVTHGEVWDGIGDQEAMNHLIRLHPEYRQRINYRDSLQTSPRLYLGFPPPPRRPGSADCTRSALIHFYGNHARHHIPLPECEQVFLRWETAIRLGTALPDDLMRFHWCCIQNKDRGAPAWNDLDHYLYRIKDIRGVF